MNITLENMFDIILYESEHDLDSSQLNEQPKQMKIQA